MRPEAVCARVDAEESAHGERGRLQVDLSLSDLFLFMNSDKEGWYG